MTVHFKGLMSAAAAGALALAFTAAPALAKTLKLNHNNPESSVTGQSFNFFADRVAELSGGDLKVRIFHAGQLGSQRESMELVQEGALDMAKTNASEMEAFEPLYSAFNLPYMFESKAHAAAVLKGDIGTQVLDATADKGFVGLGFLYEGARSFYTKGDASSLEDLKGLKIRVQPSPTAIRMVELLGAQPTPISWGELYSALQQGVVDGAENNPAALTDVRHGEVAKHFMVNQHTMIPAVYVISTEVWNGLGEDEQKTLRQAALDTFDFQMNAWDAHIEKQIEVAKSEMGVSFYEVDKTPFINAVSPMIDEAVAANPDLKPLVDGIKALAK